MTQTLTVITMMMKRTEIMAIIAAGVVAAATWPHLVPIMGGLEVFGVALGEVLTPNGLPNML